MTGTVAAIGGPPIALVYQHATRTFPPRATLALYFSVGTALSLAAPWLTGSVGYDEARVAAVLLPGTVVGFRRLGPVPSYVDAGRLPPLGAGAPPWSRRSCCC